MHSITVSEDAGTDGFANVLSRLIGLVFDIVIEDGADLYEGVEITRCFIGTDSQHYLTVTAVAGEGTFTLPIADITTVTYC